MDTNEKIIEEWLRLCKNQFTITNISFKVVGLKGGSNYSNVDILSVDCDGNFYDYEVKFRSEYSIGATEKEKPESLINQMCRKEREEKIKQIIKSKKYQKIFVTTKAMFGKRKDKIDYIFSLFNKEDIKIIFFEDVVMDLANIVNIKGRYDSQILQTIRLLKKYNLLRLE